MAGKITRQELHPNLRQELDDVQTYIDGSNNLAYENHMQSTANPHNVTKSQIGLGDIENSLQLDFETHASEANPHGATALDVGAVPDTRSLTAGRGLSGGGKLSSDREISFDVTWGDTRYAGNNSQNLFSALQEFDNGIRVRSGYVSTNAIDHYGGGIHLYLRPEPSGMVRVTEKGSTSNYNPIRAKYFMDENGRTAHTKNGSIKYGTSNPRGGSNGDIYIQY